MINLTIDGQKVQVKEGATILQAAKTGKGPYPHTLLS